MIDTFIKYLTYEKRYSKHTVTSYRNDLLQYTSFVAEHDPELDLITADFGVARAWVIKLVDGGHSTRSVNRKISTLKSFYKFLQAREYVAENPVRNLRVLKTNKPLPGFVNENEISALLDSATYSDDFEGWRDRLVLELLYGTGIRLSELLDLAPGDINWYENQLKVNGKRNKQRIIPFTKKLSTVMENYNGKKFDLFGHNANTRLIVTNKGEPGYPMFIYRIVRKYLDQFTTVDKRSPHVLRHTFATHLLNKGADLNAIKDLLGHASLAATQVYTHNSTEQLKKIFDQAHPKA